MSLPERVRTLETTEYAVILASNGAPAYFAGEGTLCWDYTNDDLYVNDDGANGWQLIGGGGGPGFPHAIFSATHTDAVVGAAVRGGMMYGTAALAWDRLLHPGAATRLLTTDANDVLWSAFNVAGTAAQTYTFGTVGGTITTSPGTLTVATANNVTAPGVQTHAITSSSNPGAAASILASSAAGLLQLVGLGIGAAGVAGWVRMLDGGMVGSVGNYWLFDETNDEIEGYVDGAFGMRLADETATVAFPAPRFLVGTGGQYAGNNPGCAIIGGTPRAIVGVPSTTMTDCESTINLAPFSTSTTITDTDGFIIGSAGHSILSGSTGWVWATDCVIAAALTVELIFMAGTDHSINANTISSTQMGTWTRNVGHDNTFIWSDGQNAQVDTMADNQFFIQATGGFRHAYDNSNYWTAQVSATGDVDLDFIGTAPGFTINEAGADVDVRIEGAADTNLICTDAGNDLVGIGTAPSYKLHVSGAANTTGYFQSSNAANYIVVRSTNGTPANMGVQFYSGATLSGAAVFSETSSYTGLISYVSGDNIQFFTNDGGGVAVKATITDTGEMGIGVAAPATWLELEETETLTGNLGDGYAAGLTLDPGYTGAWTVTRHNYIDVNDVATAGGAAVTNGAVMRFDAAFGAHAALAASFNTTDSNGDTTTWAGGVIINVNGTLYKLPAIAI